MGEVSRDYEELDVRQITPNTIPKLAKETRYSETELWDEYRDAVKKGTTAWVLMNNPFNTTRTQMEIAAAISMGKCFYERKFDDSVGQLWVCMIHGNNSRHHNGKDHSTTDLSGSRAPCLTLDPYPEEGQHG